MPAKAPRPGAGRRLAISQELKQAEGDWVRIVVNRDSVDLTLLMSSIGPEDERLCRNQAGLSIWEAVGNPSEVNSISVIYWMARRKHGEKGLMLGKAQFRDVADLIDADVEIWVGGADDEEDDDEGGADPTDSAARSETPGPASPTSSASSPGTSAETSS